MIKVSDVYPSPWISPEEITRPFAVAIKSVAVEEFRRPDGGKEHKIVLSFLRAQKRLPLNKTQAKTLAQFLGDDAEQWTGSTVVLAPATAPNHKPTIAIGIPHAPAAATGTACEICGQLDGHADDCRTPPSAEAEAPTRRPLRSPSGDPRPHLAEDHAPMQTLTAP